MLTRDIVDGTIGVIASPTTKGQPQPQMTYLIHHSIRYFACSLILSVLTLPVFAQYTEPSESTSDIFLLPYFLGNGETGVYVACSHDGLKFQWLNDGQVVMPSPAWGDESLTRDPSIVFHDNVFHLIWTTSWTSRSIGYAYSRDLKEWSTPQKIDVWGDFAAVRNTWAPELHWDPEQDEFLILWSSTTIAELRAYPETDLC